MTDQNWAALAHKFHVATDGTNHPKHHPLCTICNPPKAQQNGSKVRVETAEERTARIWSCRTYADPDPQVNKLRYIIDTLARDPSQGPKLIDAWLWTGEYDDAGAPIPTPPLHMTAGIPAPARSA